MDTITYHDPAKPAIDRWSILINAAAAAASVPACALAAIVERESGGDANARSDDGGWGLCQITAGVDENGIFTQTGAKMLDPASNIDVAAKFFLAPAIAQCAALRATDAATMDAVSTEILYFAFCAYNAGFGAVRRAIASGTDPDSVTTNDYGSGTLALYHAAVVASHAASASPTPVVAR
jgi:soluble lytic murein transglycosylase-like protein